MDIYLAVLDISVGSYSIKVFVKEKWYLNIKRATRLGEVGEECAFQ
jgi:hypothetical protein